MRRRGKLCAAVIASLLGWHAALAQTPPTEIRIGSLHASSGTFASFSTPVYDGLKLWIDETNAEGGAYVKAFDRKIPLHFITYDDQSSTYLATSLANQLITGDKVDVLVSDAGSVLTSAIQPVARNHRMLLFDINGAGDVLFDKDNPYIVLTSAPATSIWPKSLADFLLGPVAAAGYKRIALLYGNNDANAPHARALKGFITQPGSPFSIVFDEGFPTDTSNYVTILSRIQAMKPDVVIHVGYPSNDIAFFRNLEDSGDAYPMVFSMYPGLETGLLLRTVGAEAIHHAMTYVTPANIPYKPDIGMDLAQLRAAWEKTYGNKPEFGWNAVQGYTAGLIVGAALAHADTLDQLALRGALFAVSGALRTLDGPFALNPDGSQKGELLAIGQLVPDDEKKLRLAILSPREVATDKPIFNH